MEKEDNKIVKIINRIMPTVLVLMLLAGMGYLLAGQLILPNDRGVSSEDSTSLDMAFEVVHEDGNMESISLPFTYDHNDEEELVLTTAISPDMAGRWIMIWNMGHETEIYVGDELRMTVNTEGRRLFDGPIPYQYDFMRLCEGDAGKTLNIRLPKFPAENQQLGSVYFGDKASLLLRAIRPYQLSLFMALGVLTMGIMNIIRVRFLARDDARSYGLFYMSLGVSIASVWFLVNSPAAQFVFPNIETAKDCAFIFASMIPLPLLMYMARLFEGRYSVVFSILKLCSVLSFMSLLVGFLIFGISINMMFIPTEITALASLGFCFAVITIDIQSRKVKEYLIAATGLVSFIVFALLYVILFALYPYRGDSGVLFMIGVILLFTTSVISYNRKRNKQEGS